MTDKKEIRTPIKEGEVKLRPGEYHGRNGEILRRTPVKNGNPFDFPDDVKEKDWSYQWIRHSVYQNTDHSELAHMKRAGWREVHPDALNGYFRDEVPEGANHIAKEGLVLVERPERMTRDAQEEQLKSANRQYQAQMTKVYDENFVLPDGFAPISGSIDKESYQPAPGAWKPKYRPRQAVAEE